MSMKPLRTSRALLIIAPSLYECVKTAEAYGLHPGRIENFRLITRSYLMRGITAGAPFIAINRQSWRATPHGHDLDMALDAYQQQGRVRLAQTEDIAAHRMFDPVPAREVRAG